MICGLGGQGLSAGAVEAMARARRRRRVHGRRKTKPIANALPRPSPAKSPLDPDVVRELAALLEETGLSEIEIERGGTRVRVAKHGVTVTAPAMPAAAPPPMAPPPRRPTPPRKKGTLVTSPMVGTVYLSARSRARRSLREGRRQGRRTARCASSKR